MANSIQLDARLSLAFDLYDPCELAADIGTDHAHLPAALLQRGRCQHMILTDISKSALQNARNEMIRFRLMDRVSLRAGEGLAPLSEACGMISVTGMGGRTIRDILLKGRDRLRNASLILSAHTDLPLIRETIGLIGYHLEKEEPCFCAGRYYLVMRARPGAGLMSPREIRLGGPLFDSPSDQLIPYLIRCRNILHAQLQGLITAGTPDRSLISQVQEDISYYDSFIQERMNRHDSPGSASSH